MPIQPGDDADSLAARVLEREHELYPAALGAYLTGALTVDGDLIRPAPLALT